MENEDDILEKEQLFSEITVEDIPHWTDELKKGLTIQVTDCEELSPMEQEYNEETSHIFPRPRTYFQQRPFKRIYRNGSFL